MSRQGGQLACLKRVLEPKPKPQNSEKMQGAVAASDPYPPCPACRLVITHWQCRQQSESVFHHDKHVSAKMAAGRG